MQVVPVPVNGLTDYWVDCCRKTVDQIQKDIEAEFNRFEDECIIKVHQAAHTIQARYIMNALYASCEQLKNHAIENVQKKIARAKKNASVVLLCPAVAQIIQKEFNDMNRGMACLTAERFALYLFDEERMERAYFNLSGSPPDAVAREPFETTVDTYYVTMMQCSLRFTMRFTQPIEHLENDYNYYFNHFGSTSRNKYGDELSESAYRHLGEYFHYTLGALSSRARVSVRCQVEFHCWLDTLWEVHRTHDAYSSSTS